MFNTIHDPYACKGDCYHCIEFEDGCDFIKAQLPIRVRLWFIIRKWFKGGV